MKRFNKSPNDVDPIKLSDFDAHTVLRDSDRKSGLSSMRIMGIFVVFLMVFSVLFSVSIVLKDPPSDGIVEASEDITLPMSLDNVVGSKDLSSGSVKVAKDVLYGGLLAAGFDEGSCRSRYESGLYRPNSPHKPSSYLISRLRSYEALHKKCGPYTESYNKTVKLLKAGHVTGGSSECSYVVWISFSGLGNRILTLASAFLYALLTNRVLLIDPGVDMTNLFCEPFPEVSWFLPPDFGFKNQFGIFDQKSPHCHGKMLKNKNVTNGLMTPPFVYLHLVHDYDDEDKLFFCDQEQAFLSKVPWLMVKTDNYFIPSLFLIPSFEQELNNLFPSKETIFHHLGRYLFHPTNTVWGLITRYYRAYLANADERIGIQIRVFDTGTGPFQHVLDQILACVIKENLLPEVNRQESVVSSSGSRKLKAVLMTSLSLGYFEKIRDIYWEYPTLTGDIIGIYQPSHEEHQQSEKQMHNQKALAEIYLLSLTDMLVTSSWSTFGYVAQGLGALKPWILYKPENQTAPDPPCQRAMSMEPCFHAPPFYDCKAKTGIDTGSLVPHVKHCEDMSWGLKLVDSRDD